MRSIKRWLLVVLATLQFCGIVSAAVVEGYIYLGKSKPAQNVPVKIAYRPHWDRYTDSKGFFQFENVEKGKWVVLSRPEGYRVARQEIEVLSDSNDDTLRINLHLKKYGKSLMDTNVEAQVVVYVVGGPNGKIMPYLPVIASGPVTKSISTDKVGRAIFKNLPPGNYTFKASHKTYGRDSESVYVPPGNVNLETYLRLPLPLPKDAKNDK